ncbi:MAG: alpha/beta fold hydrolase [Patescibacteria group bacterium]
MHLIKSGNNIFVVLSLILITQVSGLFIHHPFPIIQPALADTLSAAAPAGQSVLAAQTDVDTSGACYSNFGRSFLLNWPYALDSTADSVPLSGIAIYVVTRVMAGGPLDLSNFRLDLRRGLEPSLSDPSRIIFSSLAPSGSTVVYEYEQGVNSLHTSLLYFTFPSPISLKRPAYGRTAEDRFYTGYLSCTNPFTNPPRYLLRETGTYWAGLSRIYHSDSNAYGSPTYTALNLLFLTPSTTSSSSPQQWNNETMKQAVPILRPLILIHGLGGKPDDWINGRTNYQTYLRSLGYPDSYLHYYSYGYKNGAYNYQGDIKEIALGLEEAVNRLSNLHKSEGGDGKVDLLGFSLGGVVARQYLSTHLTSHKVHKLITIGSPHQGVWVLSADQAVKDIPFVGQKIENDLATQIVRLVNKDKIQKLDITSAAVKQIYPGSDFLSGYYGINKRVPQDVEYATFYGDIHAEVRRKLFDSQLSKKVSIGDGLIMPESASGVPGVSPSKYAYSENTVLDLKLEKTGTGYAFGLDLPSLESLKAFHTYLLDRGDLRKDLACSALGKNDASLCK